VVRAFLDAGLLPRVVTGTSAGGLVAALTCTRTDEELKELLIPELSAKLSACEEPFKIWFKRFWTTGARFDSVAWARKACFSRSSHYQADLISQLPVLLVYSRVYDFSRSVS
jgi:predicted acylesterase/phospholipase RssA